MIKKVHEHTHLPLRSMELLLKIAGKWNPWMNQYISMVVGPCNVCLRTGDPEPSRKFSVTKLEKNFNDRVYFDILYWKRKPVLHLVDTSPGYSETRLMGLGSFLL